MATTLCPQCKASNRDTAQFCVECGALLSKTESPPASESATMRRSQPGPSSPPASSSPASGPPASSPPVSAPPASSPPVSGPPPAGSSRVLQNRYRIEQELGRGGFGAVYKAWDLNLERPCAVKENLAVSVEAQRQFMREATVLANLSHPNLPRVIDHFIIPGEGQYLVMDFVDGEDLVSILKKKETIPVAQALEWVMQVANALQYMHGQEPPLFHRDIKPANIRVTPKGQAMLVDFGLVKVFDPFLKTTVGARAITPGYAPPEQYGQGKTDARTDIYALGATLYNLLTGYEPMESVVRLSGEHMMSAHVLNPSVPLAVSDLIDRAMALEPASRFQNVADFKAALQASREIMELEGQDKNLVTVIVEPGLESEPFIGAPVETVTRPPSGPPPSLPPSYPATSVIEAPHPAAGRPPSAGAVPKPVAKTKWLPIGLAAAAFLVLCIGASALLAAMLFSDGDGTPTPVGNNAVEATITARIAMMTATGSDLTQKTNTVQAQRTSTGLARATQTSAVQTRRSASTGTAAVVAKIKTSTAAAKEKATEQASNAVLSDLESQASLVFGPKSGRIAHKEENGYLEMISAPVGLRNFILEVVFFNPYPTSEGLYTFGTMFRDGGEEVDYRLIFSSEKEWEFRNHTGPESWETVASDTIEDLDTSETGSNKIRLYVYEDQAWLFVNDKFVSELDVSAHYSGSISIGIGYYKDDEITGKLTEYKDFTIWSIPTQ